MNNAQESTPSQMFLNFSPELVTITFRTAFKLFTIAAEKLFPNSHVEHLSVGHSVIYLVLLLASVLQQL